MRYLLGPFFVLLVLVCSAPCSATGWRQVVGPDGAVPAGFGDPSIDRCVEFGVYDGRLWAVGARLDGGTSVWSTADGEVWTSVAVLSDQPAAQPLSVVAGDLYLATRSEVWRLQTDAGFTAVGPEFLGDAHTHATALGSFHERLYLGVGTADDATEIWFTADGETWKLATRFEPDPGVFLVRFGIGRMAVSGGWLYVDSRSFQPSIDFNIYSSEVLRSHDGLAFEYAVSFAGGSEGDGLRALQPWKGELVAGAGYARSWGAEVWRTSDNGLNWEEISEGGFGDAENMYVSSLARFGAALYAGTENRSTGCEIWMTVDGTTWSQANDDGFGSQANVSVTAMKTFDGSLYAATTADQGGLLVWRLGQVQPCLNRGDPLN